MSWDDPLPINLKSIWENFRNELPLLNNLVIPRRVLIENVLRIELHGFCDSSERANGACIYLRSLNTHNDAQISLLCAKSKVAPIKAMTIPKLELCAALLLSRLVDKVIKSMKLQFNEIFLWTDSTITLVWIRRSSNLLKTFTANCVSEIQSLTSNCQWRYVPTAENPADIVSRGLCPNLILQSNLWWSGPPWLTSSSTNWPTAH